MRESFLLRIALRKNKSAGEGERDDFWGLTRELLKRDLLRAKHKTCLLYTSDAADERSSVDLGGRRIIKKKKQKE